VRYRKLGRSGLLVSELCLGTNMFGGASQQFWKDLGGLDQKAVNTVVAAAIEGGVNFIDTADGYSGGESEMRVGQALEDLAVDRSSIVICTKAGMAMGSGPNAVGCSRAHLLHACESSLNRLGVDYVDLYMLHMLDPATPLDESLRALDDLVRAGKVRYVGCSNFAGWELMKALGISERAGLARFEVIEAHWSIATREIEREVVPLARSETVGIMAWGALLGGLLTGKYRRDGSSEVPGHRGGRVPKTLNKDKVHDIIDTMREIAHAHAVTPTEVALAFILHEKAAASVIFGSTNAQQVAANVRASGLTLSSEELTRLDQLSALPLDFGGNMTASMRTSRQQYACSIA